MLERVMEEEDGQIYVNRTQLGLDRYEAFWCRKIIDNNNVFYTFKKNLE
jgi:hypothetical protein